jgi:hypothetical protein
MFPDRLQVRLSTNGASVDVGTTATDVGDFTALLLDINPTYTTSGYPNTWTQFTVTLSGIASPTQGRLALRYFVENGGPGGTNSDYIGIDSLEVSAICGPTPTPTPSVTPTATPQLVTPTATPSPTPPTHAVNLSTRLFVQTGASVGIGGFILTGTAPKRLLFRGIGPSLTGFGIADALADPTLELLTATGTKVLANDNWRDTQETEIEATGIAPTNNLEAAILTTLDPGGYTVILRGKEFSSGVGLVEIYDLDQSSDSKLANLSTRAFVLTGNNVVIAGFILNGDGDDTIIARGIGPSLIQFGISDVLADPMLELRNANGLVIGNNDWQDDPNQAALLMDAGLAPTNDLESAVVATLPPGIYTAVMSGNNHGTGVGLVEIYDLGQGVK